MPFFSGKCTSLVRLAGKTALVTGCNTGIGKETVKDFYKRGAKVLMACRNLEKAENAKKEIEDDCKDVGDKGELIIIKLDLSSLKSVRECAQTVLDSESQLNILVNNAGVMMCPKEYTEDGFEMQFGTNHLAHFLLTLMLLPKLKNSTPSRIVTVSSRAHTRYSGSFDDPNYKSRPYSAMEAYSQSKLANVLFSRELDKKLKQHSIAGVNTFCLHPGVISTELGRHLDKTVFSGFVWIWRNIGKHFAKNPYMGAQTTIYCAVDEKCASESGLYYSDCVPVRPAAAALDDEKAKKLWEMSLNLVGISDPFDSLDVSTGKVQ